MWIARMASVLALCAVSCPVISQARSDAPVRLRGEARLEGGAVPRAPRVFAVSASVRADGRVVRPDKPAIFAAARSGSGVAAEGGRFELRLAAGHYALFAFDDLDGDGIWDPGTPEPIGWHADEDCGCFDPLDVTRDRDGLRLVLRAPTPFPAGERVVEHGSFTRLKGIPVVRLHGDARQRGFAHGQLLAPQIVDFFRDYVLEDKLRSARAYRDGFEPFLESHFAWPEAFRVECEAVIAGMRASGAALAIPELGRDFSLTDLYAINSYIETRAMRSSCTQFAAWGERTAGTDVDGGMVTGRNMDGECDLRKVTVSHFLLFAVEPSEAGAKRYVSMMWPGFVGTISGINEDGLYAMENAGTTGPGPVVKGLVPISWTMREALARLGGDASAGTVKALCDGFGNEVGGSCNPGCVMLFAVPFTGQERPAFVFEGDRFGDAIRFAGDVWPQLPQALVCSNHHHVYGADPDAPGVSFGVEPSFSSRWRYEAGAQKLESWHRVGRAIGTFEMRELLQTVAHGTTEYAIITRPNAGEFDVALASLEAEPWDAPYRAWVTFGFDEPFAAPAGRDDGGR